MLLLLLACGSPSIKISEPAEEYVIVDGDGDGYLSDEDCDDANPQVNPGAPEICDGIDNNCSGEVDEGVLLAWYFDLDSDGFGDPDNSTLACSAVSDTVAVAADCDDTNNLVNPAAEELCDGIDNDCDVEIDEDLFQLYYADEDGDGYGNPDSEVLSCEEPEGVSLNDRDCDDTASQINPGAEEICDGIDNDCNLEVDENLGSLWYLDQDGDGYGDPASSVMACEQPENHVANLLDCDAIDAEVNPGAAEICDSYDNDCDGLIDESESSDALTWFLDADGDGFGDPTNSQPACTPPFDAASGHPYVLSDEDCDDSDPNQNPNAVELCNGENDDCDNDIDESAVDALIWFRDSDGDGFGDGSFSIDSCSAPTDPQSSNIFVDNTDDCNDGDPYTNPDATDQPEDGIDNNCDGQELCYTDYDSDGYASALTLASQDLLCGNDVYEAQPAQAGGDCDDYNPAINPGESELCDAVDRNCDGSATAGAIDTTTWYYDADADGFGEDQQALQSCSNPTAPGSNYVLITGDCEPSESDIYPTATELCDGIDQNCNSDIDEGVLGISPACPALSCDSLLNNDSSASSGSYYLDVGTIELFECDMNTDGGGWTNVVQWNRIDNADSKADLYNELFTEFNNMSTVQENSGHLLWKDSTGTGDVLALAKDINVPNSGEILYDIHYSGQSMEASATFFYAGAVDGSEHNIECGDDLTTSSNYLSRYSNPEKNSLPSYTCPTQSKNFTWIGEQQQDLGIELNQFRLRSFHHDTCCDYSYFYKLELWVR